MPFDWTGFLILAEELSKRQEESCKRSAISRAYYSVFNPAFERAQTTAGPLPPNTSTHSWCWKRYISSVSLDCKKLGISGDRLKKRRVTADYKKADIPRLNEEVERALADAHQLSKDLANLPPNQPKS